LFHAVPSRVFTLEQLREKGDLGFQLAGRLFETFTLAIGEGGGLLRCLAIGCRESGVSVGR